MSGSRHKRKGDGFERELAAYFNDHLFGGQERVSRAPLSGGGRQTKFHTGTDLIGLPDLHVEAKRTERFRPREAMEQAKGHCFNGSVEGPYIPVVINRRNHQATDDSLVVMRLEDFVRLYREYLKNFR